MSTTTVLGNDTATIVREDMKPFSLGAVIAGAAIAAAVGFFLVTVGAGVGLALTSAPVLLLVGLVSASPLMKLGALVFALPMKIEGGSGGPVRVVALVPRQ